MPLALIDGDILIYRVGFTTQDADIDIARWRLDELLRKILEGVSSEEFKVYLTASNDRTAFRKLAYPEYKANRKAPRPIHYEALRQHLVDNHGASVSTTIEADDAIGIDSGIYSDSIIVSIDKDLLQLPGMHYNFVKEEFKEQTKINGLRFFYKQLLMGDKADNIKGVEGIGEVKAERILNSAEDYCEEAWFNAVRDTYNNDAEMWMNGECLWILREPFHRGIWSYHPLGSTLLHAVDTKPSYLLKQNEDILESTTQEMYTDGRKLLGINQVEPTMLMEEPLR